MNQQQIHKIRETVNTHGLSKTISLFGNNKDIIRQAYIDNPESYLDYLIGNLDVVKSEYKMTRLVYNYKKNILTYEDDSNEIYVDDYIWNYFYGGVMQFDKTKIETIITEWLFKHYPKLSERKPMVYSDLWEITRKWKHTESRNVPDYMIVSRSVADYLKTINVGKINNIGG